MKIQALTRDAGIGPLSPLSRKLKVDCRYAGNNIRSCGHRSNGALRSAGVDNNYHDMNLVNMIGLRERNNRARPVRFTLLDSQRLRWTERWL